MYVIDSFSIPPVQRGINVAINGVTTALEECKMGFSLNDDVSEAVLHDAAVFPFPSPYDQTGKRCKL